MKRIISILFIVLLIISLIPLSVFSVFAEDETSSIESTEFTFLIETSTSTYHVGDTDGNDDVDILDATLIQKLLAHLETDKDGKMAERGSYDNSGKLIISDATRIQRSLAELPGAELIGTIREYKS